MAILACYAGLLLWVLFLRLDSLRYPLKTYGDVAERILGKTARHICTFLQTLQLIVLVGVQCDQLLLRCVTFISQVAIVCLMNGQALSQIAKGKVS